MKRQVHTKKAWANDFLRRGSISLRESEIDHAILYGTDLNKRKEVAYVLS